MRRSQPDEAAAALAIVQEAARWSARFGTPIWDPDSFTLSQYIGLARAEELVGGYSGEAMHACMWLQTRDPVVWPDDPIGEALYVHKLAVRRSSAGEGWPKRLLAFAMEQARASGAALVRLDTIPNDRMILLYQALGWEPVDAGPLRFGGRLLVRMERRLTDAPGDPCSP